MKTEAYFRELDRESGEQMDRRAAATLTPAKGFWKADLEAEGGVSLWWQIGDEQISDAALRNWCYHHFADEHKRHVGPCILKFHTDAYASRCRACNGRGMIGGFDFGEQAYRDEQCPECLGLPTGVKP